eukprot:COSAG01_NODE_25510_length_742_cov_1.698289_2_plen_180_part_01
MLHVHGDWVPVNGPLVCQKCAPIVPPPHAIACNATTETCQFKCEEGYFQAQPEGEHGARYTCGGAGGSRDWQPVNGPLVCFRCDGQPNQDQGQPDRTTHCNSTQQTCEVRCRKGYGAVPTGAQQPILYQCTYDSTSDSDKWEPVNGKPLTCVTQLCSPVLGLPHTEQKRCIGNELHPERV